MTRQAKDIAELIKLSRVKGNLTYGSDQFVMGLMDVMEDHDEHFNRTDFWIACGYLEETVPGRDGF